MSECPYDYAREIADAQNADERRYPQPGQWVGAEWHEPEPEDLR